MEPTYYPLVQDDDPRLGRPRDTLENRKRAVMEIADRLLTRTREICAEKGAELHSRQIEALAQAVAEELIR